MSTQKAHGRLAVLNQARELHRYRTIFSGGGDKTGPRQFIAKFGELFMIGGRKSAPGEVDHSGLFSRVSGNLQRHTELPHGTRRRDLTIHDAGNRIDASLSNCRFSDFGTFGEPEQGRVIGRRS